MGFSYIWNKICKKIAGKSIRNSKISKKSFINSGSNVFNSSFDDYSYCGYDCWIIETDIGKFCSVSNNVKIGGPSHPIDWVSTSPVFHSKKNVLGTFFENDNRYDPFVKTEIGNDVWVGEGSIILAGVKIGNGAIVGAGSVVTKDIPDYEIWAGNPAKLIRKRFDDETIKLLLKSEWWNMSGDDLKKYSPFFNQPSIFLEGVKKQ